MIRRIAFVVVAAGLLAPVAWWSWRWGMAAVNATRRAAPPVATVRRAPSESPGKIPQVRATADPSVPAYSGPAWFTEMTDESGVDFRHVSGANAERPFPASNGSGVAAFDYDLDGACDLYFATGTPFPIDPTRTDPINRIYRNRGGWRFDDVTLASGLGHNGFSAGIAVGDYDADGFPDVCVTCFGPDCLYRNLGDGTFERVKRTAADVADERWATGAAFLDYDADGLLDLYVCNYAKWTWETRQFCGDRVRNIQIYCSPTSVEAEPDVLYRNRGDGAFDDVSAATGVGARVARGQGVVAADVNDDGLIDLYVGNDLQPNSLFINRGDGTFRDQTELSGAGYDRQGRSQASMGMEAADFNGDGRLDLFCTNFQDEHNALYENLGGENFQDVSYRYGLADASIPWVGWGTSLTDFDLDGVLDAIVVNGHVDDNRHLLGQDAPYESPALVWRQVKGHFELLGAEAGEYFAARHVGRGLAVADLDNDGDPDVVVVHQDHRPALLRNDRLSPASGSRGVVAVRLVGTRSNRDGIGAMLKLHAGGKTLVRPIKGGGSYLSASEYRQTIAAPGDSALELEIAWPGGGLSRATLESGKKFVIIEPRDPQGSASVYSGSLCDD